MNLSLFKHAQQIVWATAWKKLKDGRVAGWVRSATHENAIEVAFLIQPDGTIWQSLDPSDPSAEPSVWYDNREGIERKVPWDSVAEDAISEASELLNACVQGTEDGWMAIEDFREDSSEDDLLSIHAKSASDGWLSLIGDDEGKPDWWEVAFQEAGWDWKK